MKKIQGLKNEYIQMQLSLKSRITSDKLEETGRELQWLICILCLKCMKELRKTTKDLNIANLPVNIIQ